ncbi:DUF3310 domain-containing protein [Campylobacter cuniculorum]|uniref:DUF3310 domain protein n=2 Tax=Campylobacter cuniculorum TaxID=374106 RepID=A0A1W6BV33_9BACT|nr:DUF3310 domain-containing protein [Campylobacter cuniculorum]ARJ55946.1 hypothetical protein (DUF3310 domain) [Campylobacter cuniculorum DSM 23162 = LMG 24588]QOR05164.1 DUF3310 domain-containing protein [Campylobacter cuniculorum]
MHKKEDKTNPLYYRAYGFESIELLESLFSRMKEKRLIFSIGNALKYVLRCKFKENCLLDLQKARWHILRCEKLISEDVNISFKDLSFLEPFLQKIKLIDEDICEIVEAFAVFALKADYNSLSKALACLNLEIQIIEIKKREQEEDMQNV